MIRNKWLSYFWKILWIIGLIILARLSFSYEIQSKQSADATFNLIPLIWFKVIISILFGLYLSLILVKKWSFKINPSLIWCVSIPSLLLSFTYPITATLASFNNLPEVIANSSILYWLINVRSSSNIFGIVAGLSLILSLFNDSRCSEKC
ncbi:hypothetical protein [uncultured Rummeliibacillus sp.]|uniref:hypothetical protein n=1 Tax=uncultured Rummeliibacillus sp. TaxID=762292 RepID=UPI0026279960|nr:hypothetical protein [uncultured Rummeliibacillus sp.]